jgi:hypothetical protein
MPTARFIEVTVQNYIISHGFDNLNKEITEKVIQNEPVKKLIAVDRILSVTEKYLLTTYGHGRLIYWEYLEPYDEITGKLNLE